MMTVLNVFSFSMRHVVPDYYKQRLLSCPVYSGIHSLAYIQGPLSLWTGVTTDSSTNYVLHLILDRNSLRGSIPTEIGNLTSLKGLFFKNNYLSGSIPAQIGSLTSLKYLYLEGNTLSGSITTEIGSLTSLQYLYLYGNALIGSIPDGVCDAVRYELVADCDNCDPSKEGCCNYCL